MPELNTEKIRYPIVRAREFGVWEPVRLYEPGESTRMSDAPAGRRCDVWSGPGRVAPPHRCKDRFPTTENRPILASTG